MLGSETSILQQLIKGNQLAFKQIYDLHSESVYRLAFNVLKDVKSAEEIVQDTFLQVWNSREGIDCEGNIEAYLYVICRNKSFNKLKVMKRQQQLFTPLTDVNDHTGYVVDDSRSAKELHETLEKIIEKLPERQQLIFRLCRLEGFSHKEIADRLGISIQTVKNQMVSALRVVRSELQKLEKDLPLSLFYLFFFM